MQLSSTLILIFPTAIMLSLVACGGSPTPGPDIEATVEAVLTAVPTSAPPPTAIPTPMATPGDTLSRPSPTSTPEHESTIIEAEPTTPSHASPDSRTVDPVPFLSLPFSLNQEPRGIMPMGETINHSREAPWGHPGIDFQWDNKASVLIAASGEVAEIVLLAHSQSQDPDLVVHSIVVLTNEFMVLYEVTDLYSFNPDIAVGSKVTTGQILGYALDIGSGDGWHMIHWAFGNYQKMDSPMTTPEGETRNYSFSYLCPVPYFTDAERGRLSRVWESASYEHKDRFPEVCNGPYKNY